MLLILIASLSIPLASLSIPIASLSILITSLWVLFRMWLYSFTEGQNGRAA